VQYHLLPPKRRGLFWDAISESGSILCPWALQTVPRHIAYRIECATGVFRGNTRALVKYLKKLGSRKFTRAAVGATIVNSIKLELSLAFSAVLEPDYNDAFITESRCDLLKMGNF
jgi:hypothetical protein